MRHTHHATIERNRLLYMLSAVGGHGYVLVTLPILTGYLSPEQFGFYIILVQIVTIIQAASLALFSSSLLRFYAEYEGEERRRFVGTILLTFVGLQVLIAAVLYLGRYHWLLIIFPNITVRLDPHVLYAMLWMVLVSSRGLALTFIKTIERPLLVLTQVLVYGALFIPLLYGLVVIAGLGLQGALKALVLAELGSLLMLLMRLRNQAALTWCPLYVKKVLVFSAPLAVSSLLFIVLSNMDRIVLSRYVNLADLGVYGIGFMVGNIAALIVTANISAYSPRMLKVMKTEGNDAARSLGAYFIKDAFAMMGFAVAGLVVFNDLFLFYLGSGNTAAAASLVVVGVAAGHLARNQFLFIRHGLFSMNRTGLILLLDIALLGFGFVLAHILALFWGMQGVGFTFLIGYVLVIPLALQLTKRHFQITIPPRQVVMAIFFIALLTASEVYLDAIGRSFANREYWAIKSLEILVAVIFYGKYPLGLVRSLRTERRGANA